MTINLDFKVKAYDAINVLCAQLTRDMFRDGFEDSMYEAKAKASSHRGQGQGQYLRGQSQGQWS